jgi:uncharacterized protein
MTMPGSVIRLSAPTHSILSATWILSAALYLFPLPAAAQSFNCANAYYPDEKMICNEPGLARFDERLDTLFRLRFNRLDKEQREAFQNHETAFVHARRRCRENYRCIEQSYRNRIHELQGMLSEDEDRQPEDAISSSGRTAETSPADRSASKRNSSRADRRKTENPAGVEPEDPEIQASGSTRTPAPEPVEPARRAQQKPVAPAAPAPSAAEAPPEPQSTKHRAATAEPSKPPSEHHAERNNRKRHHEPAAKEASAREKEPRAADTGSAKQVSAHEREPRAADTGSEKQVSAHEREPRAAKTGAAISAKPSTPPTERSASAKPTIRWVDPPPAR